MTVTPCQDHYDCSECGRHLDECLTCARQYYSAILDAAQNLRDASANLVDIILDEGVETNSPISEALLDTQIYLREFDKHWYTSDNYDKEGFRK